MTTTARNLTAAKATRAYRALLTVLAEERGYPAFTVHPVVEQGVGRWPSGPVLCRNFEDRQGAYAIVWEGDYDWVFIEALRSAAEKLGVHIEAYSGWALSLYPA